MKFGASGFLELKIPKKFNKTLYLKFGEKIYYLMTLILIFLFLTVNLKSFFILLKHRNWKNKITYKNLINVFISIYIDLGFSFNY